MAAPSSVLEITGRPQAGISGQELVHGRLVKTAHNRRLETMFTGKLLLAIKQSLLLAGTATVLALSLSTLLKTPTTLHAMSCDEAGYYAGVYCASHSAQYCIACVSEMCTAFAGSGSGSCYGQCMYGAWWC